MWITSQDERQLLKPDRIFCEGRSIICDTLHWQSNTIGEYSTKEKAIKVFYMIQRELKKLEIAKINTGCVVDYKVIFRMPSDDEVE